MKPLPSAELEIGLGTHAFVGGRCRDTGVPSPAGARRSRSSKRVSVASGALATAGALSAALLALSGCGSSPDQKSLTNVQLAVNGADSLFYDDGELKIYQSKIPITLPILRPVAADLKVLGETKMSPYGRMPWFTKDDVRVQVSWTLSNLDDQPHNTVILVDPWNEFVRYWPGISQVSDEESLPDLSGIELGVQVEGKGRVNGVFTYDDMDELATDLATAQSLIDDPPVDPNVMDGTGYAGIGINSLVNHAFDLHNRSGTDRLLRSFIPKTIDGLIGFDLGLKTTEEAKVAIQIAIELLDKNGNRINSDGDVLTDGSGQPPRTLTAPAAAMK